MQSRMAAFVMASPSFLVLFWVRFLIFEMRTTRGGRSARRDRLLAAVVIKAALGLLAEPASLDIFHQQRARAVLRIREALVQHLHDGKARVEADEIGEL